MIVPVEDTGMAVNARGMWEWEEVVAGSGMVGSDV